jgi:hypothetical protein
LKNSRKKTDKPIQWTAAGFLGRLILACTAVIVLFYIISPFYMRLLLPVFAWQIELLNPNYKVAHKDMIRIRQINYLQMDIAIKPTDSSDPKRIPESGHVTRHKAQAGSLCIAPIIIFSLILSWPNLSIRRRLNAFIFSLPLIVLIQCMDYPIIFLSNIAAAYSDNKTAITVSKIWSHILNNGGRQFLSLIAFFILISPYYLKHERTSQPMPDEPPVTKGKNSPCSCGSGKKYKNCCLSNPSDTKQY